MNSGKRLKILESVEKEIKKTKFDFHKTKLGIIQLVRTQNFPKKKYISYPLIRTRTCTNQGVRNVCFS